MNKRRNDKNFFQRNFQTIAKAGIVLIPTIYTTLFLGSMWDPYGNTENLPVAIVNNDRSVEYNGKTLSVGDELSDKLKDKKSLDFHFVDSEEASSGLKNGKYYMVITIPENFSENASTLLDDSPRKMELSYSTNPGTNYIASKMSESALTKIEKEVSSSVTQSYAETIFEQLGTIGDGFSDAADGALQIYDGADKLSEGNQEISENLHFLADSTLAFEGGIGTLRDGLKAYTDGVERVYEGAGQLNEGIGQLSSAAGSGTGELNEGAKTLKKGIADYTDGVSKASEGAAKLRENSGQLLKGAETISDGAKQLDSAGNSVLNGMSKMSESLAASLSDENKSQIKVLQGGINSVSNGIDELNKAVSGIEIPDLSVVSKGLSGAANSVAEDTRDAGATLSEIQKSLQSMIASHPELANDSNFAALQRELSKCSADIGDIGKQLTVMQDTMSGLSSVSEMGEKLDTLKSSVSALDTGAKQVLPAASSTISNLENGLETVQNVLDRKGTNTSEMGLIQAVSIMNGGLDSLSEGADTLAGGIGVYTSGVAELDDGMKVLESNSSALNSGADRLSGGVGTLVKSLTDGVAQLQNGSKALYDGTSELVNNNDSLNSGAEQVKNGAAQIRDGAEKLADGSDELGEGIITLGNGAEELKTALSDGADEVNSINASEDTYKMFASPVESSETFCTTVATNGNAMAAYMMAVGLWVAGLAFCIILDPKKRKISNNPVGDWTKQSLELCGLAVAQAVVMVILLRVFNGFEPMYLGRTLLVACVSSIAFLIFEYTVNYFGGVIGDFILLVLMVIQLSGCAGTYPKELSGSFYQAINPFLPFTYVVHGFRSGIASGQSIARDVAFMGIMAVVFAAFLLVGFIERGKREDKAIISNDMVAA